MMSSSDESPWHDGEQAVQRRAGSYESMLEIGPRVMRAEMPQQHRDFFGLLPFVALGVTDASGQPWATLLAGAQPGFIQSPDATHLRIGALPPHDDPVARWLAPGVELGLLGIELPTRRRNRANGRIESLDPQGFTAEVTQSFGNCPRYIQRREALPAEPATEAPPASRRSTRLDAAGMALVHAADTFFIATHAAGGLGSGGSDVSHRGGRPGFVHVDEDGSTLSWPDFDGNGFFNTLGNLEVDARAGLVFPDFAGGGLLHVAGHVEIVWGGAALDSFEGAQRLLRMKVQQSVMRPDALPLRWRFIEASPALQGTGVWG